MTLYVTNAGKPDREDSLIIALGLGASGDTPIARPIITPLVTPDILNCTIIQRRARQSNSEYCPNSGATNRVCSNIIGKEVQ